MITFSLITAPLTDRQRYALAALDNGSPWSDSTWMTAVEVAAAVKAQTGQKQFGQVSILLTSLICRGLVKRCRSGDVVLYSRTGVAW